MIPNAIRLPERIKNAMDMLLPGLDADDVTFEVGLPALRAGTVCTPPAALERIGSSLPGRIVIHPTAWEPGTAAGVALIAHEMYHQRQFLSTPDFMEQYDREKRRVEARGLPPWENRFERPAYEFEAQVYRRALHDGLAEGSWVPLLVEKGLASEARRPGRFPAGAVAAGLAFGVVVIAGLRGANRG